MTLPPVVYGGISELKNGIIYIKRIAFWLLSIAQETKVFNILPSDIKAND